MKMDRNLNADGRGKYALVLMRNMPADGSALRGAVGDALETLKRANMLDYGEAHGPNEFFLIRLKDRFAGDALRAYADAAKSYADNFASSDLNKFQSFYQWAVEVLKMAGRAGDMSAHCKDPD